MARTMLASDAIEDDVLDQIWGARRATLLRLQQTATSADLVERHIKKRGKLPEDLRLDADATRRTTRRANVRAVDGGEGASA